MGCGTSTPTNSFSPPNGAANSGGSRASPSRNETIVSKPLSKSKSYRHGAPITQGELNNQRNDFWSSRVDGNVVMWQAIRSAAEALLGDDVVLANAILEASSISTPNGSLEICYDERGRQYKVPLFCYSNPSELTNEPICISTPEATDPPSARAPAASVPGVPVRLRIRINPGDINITVDAKTGHSVSELKSLIVEHVKSQAPKLSISIDHDRQRIIFMGKEMTNKTKLSDAGVDDTKVVQVFLRPANK